MRHKGAGLGQGQGDSTRNPAYQHPHNPHGLSTRHPTMPSTHDSSSGTSDATMISFASAMLQPTKKSPCASPLHYFLLRKQPGRSPYHVLSSNYYSSPSAVIQPGACPGQPRSLWLIQAKAKAKPYRLANYETALRRKVPGLSRRLRKLRHCDASA